MSEEKSTASKKLEELLVDYKITKSQQGKAKDFDFDKEFAKGLNAEEAKAEMHRRIRLWKWEK